MNYTPEQTEWLRTEYLADPTRATADRLAEELGHPDSRSVIAKLASMKIYKTNTVKLSKTGEPVIRKEDMARDIGELFGLEIPSLAKMAKLELMQLYKALKK